MKYLKWAAFAIFAIGIYLVFDQKDDITKTVIISSVGLAYMIYEVAKAVEANHQQTVRMFEHLQSKITPPNRYDSEL